MVVESFAIIMVILLMAFIYLRAGKKNYGLAVLPLALVPFANGSFIILTDCVVPIPGNLAIFYMIVAVLSLVVSCILYGLLSKNLLGKISRRVYLCLCGGFSVILTTIFLSHALLGL